MNAADMFDLHTLNLHIEAGYVRAQTHPVNDWYIYNYTEKCAWERNWDDVTLACRGLVLDQDDEVIARPFRKFFNLGEPGAADIDMADTVVILDKVDGSLGILLPDATICTRGSFTSVQAVWATEHYRRNYDGEWAPEPDCTYLFEIIYPDNRIVVDYGDREDLVLLGKVHIPTGVSSVDCPEWKWTRVTEFHGYPTLYDAMQAPDRDNAEGFVVWRPRGDDRIKIKYEEYKRLHKFMTQVTPKHVWEALSNGRSLDVEFAGAPDEFHDWVRIVAADLTGQVDAITLTARVEFSTCPDNLSRKDFALSVKDHPLKGYLFRLLDGREIESLAWKEVKPSGQYTVRQVSSDAD